MDRKIEASSTDNNNKHKQKLKAQTDRKINTSAMETKKINSNKSQNPE